jgi:hypothetical protein
MTNTKFSFSDNDNEKINIWDKHHKNTCKYFDDGSEICNPVGAIGGRLTYSFTPTGLGLITSVECACGEKLNLTDFDMW